VRDLQRRTPRARRYETSVAHHFPRRAVLCTPTRCTDLPRHAELLVEESVLLQRLRVRVRATRQPLANRVAVKNLIRCCACKRPAMAVSLTQHPATAERSRVMTRRTECSLVAEHERHELGDVVASAEQAASRIVDTERR
jgi:hypothetical protein